MAKDVGGLLAGATYRIDGSKNIGSAFVLGRPTIEDPKLLRYVLVTAAHVLENNPGEGVVLLMRIQMGTPSHWEMVPVPLRIRVDGKPVWVQNPKADVAAMYISAPQGILEEVASTAALADEKSFAKGKVALGAEIKALGFPFGQYSVPSGFPVLRGGWIASPLPPVHETFLADFTVFPGNSGGPVYYAGRPELILGLVSRQVLSVRGGQSTSENLGIIVAANFIKATIEMLPVPSLRAGTFRIQMKGKKQS